MLTQDPKALQLLFQEDLYLIKNQAAKPAAIQQDAPVVEPVTEFDYLGENNRFFLLLVNEPSERYLCAPDLEILVKILAAKGMDLKDVAILNMHHYGDLNLVQLKSFFSCNKICLFGIAPHVLGMPNMPSNEASTYEDVQILATFSLQELQQTQHKKVAFWNAIKNF